MYILWRTQNEVIKDLEVQIEFFYDIYHKKNMGDIMSCSPQSEETEYEIGYRKGYEQGYKQGMYAVHASRTGMIPPSPSPEEIPPPPPPPKYPASPRLQAPTPKQHVNDELEYEIVDNYVDKSKKCLK